MSKADLLCQDKTCYAGTRLVMPGQRLTKYQNICMNVRGWLVMPGQRLTKYQNISKEVFIYSDINKFKFNCYYTTWISFNKYEF